MKDITITYGRTWQLGRYEPERIEIQATLAPKEDVNKAFDKLKKLVHGNSISLAKRSTVADRKKKAKDLRDRADLIESLGEEV